MLKNPPPSTTTARLITFMVCLLLIPKMVSQELKVQQDPDKITVLSFF